MKKVLIYCDPVQLKLERIDYLSGVWLSTQSLVEVGLLIGHDQQPPDVLGDKFWGNVLPGPDSTIEFGQLVLERLLSFD